MDKRMVNLIVLFLVTMPVASSVYIKDSLSSITNTEGLTFEQTTESFHLQWEKSYGTKGWWSARYEGPQPVGDADNDGNNELLIGGRDPFMRVMKWNQQDQTYYEQSLLVDPVWGIGYSFWGLFPQPFGSATGFGIADIDNDGENEIGVAWGQHFSAFKWDGTRYQRMGRYIIEDNSQGWGTTLDCIIGDCDNDGENEVIVTGGYSSGVAEVVVIHWDGEQFIKESEWNQPDDFSVYFPWIADVDEDGLNEIIVNTNCTFVLNWNGDEWDADIVAEHPVNQRGWYPFGCVSKDSDYDGKPEIHVTFYGPYLKIYEFNNGDYLEKASFSWPNEEGTIEAIDIGDVDNDGFPEVAVGTNHVHILSWNGNEYIEKYVINDTHGFLAVTCVGDMDNDGKNEVHAGSVGEEAGSPYKAWIFEYE